MRHEFTRTLTVGVATAACLLSGSAAFAAPATPTSAETGKYCAILVGKPTAPDGVSPELDRACSALSRDDARRHLNRPGARTAGEAEVAARTRLMTWYSDVNYGGDAQDVYGNDGTCDYSGYRLVPNSDWRRKLSSAEGFRQCNWAAFYNPTQILKFSYRLPVAYVGIELNDNVGVIQVSRFD